MTKFNRGEWSELYVALYVLEYPKLKIVDFNLNIINDNIFTIENVIKPSIDDVNYFIMTLNESSESYKNDCGACNRKSSIKLLKKIYFNILNAPKGSGSFSIERNSTKKILKSSNIKFKGKANKKADLILLVNDLISKRTMEMAYSIKSMIGSPSTLLNASKATNFEFLAKGLSCTDVELINTINTKTKLMDRLNKIFDLSSGIKFLKVSNNIFEQNLQMIDTQMPFILQEVLLESYRTRNKNLLDLFLKLKQFSTKTIAYKKLTDLLEALSFGMFPNRIWDGNYEVNGGILIAKKDGIVGLLDYVYHKKEVSNFLALNTKLDSPSSSRFHMLELKRWNNSKDTYLFTLNLQIRYKR